MLLRIIIFILLVYLFTKFFKKLFAKPQQKPQRNTFFNNATPKSVDEMVQDPVCNVYIPKREAIPFFDAETTYYFCSHDCLEKFKADRAEDGP